MNSFDVEPGALRIASADFANPRLGRFLQAHLDDMAPTAPAESRHALDLAALDAPHVRLWTAVVGNDIVGTAALAAAPALESGHEELKSMRTDQDRRGKGIASALLAHALSDARSRNIRRISLETGSMEFFRPARALYSKAGFGPCPPFGSYAEDPNSVFMTLTL